MTKLLLDGNFQRVGPLVFLPGLLRSLGADPTEILLAAGLSMNALDHPEKSIPYTAGGCLLAMAAAKTQCPHFGLLLGARVGTASLGLIGELMRNAPTLGAALRDFARYQYRNSHGSVVYLLKNGKNACFGYAIYQPDVEGSSLICDTSAMAAYTIVRELIQSSSVEGMEILISRAEPLNLAPYQRLFTVKVNFDADQTAALFPASWLDRPVAGADARVRKDLEKRFTAPSTAGELDIVTQLRRELRVALLSGQITGDKMAAQLGLNRRTLLRRLVEQGVTFQQIQDETRCEFAKQLLAHTRLSIARIGIILRYSDPGVFTRAFVRWTKMTPSEWRSRNNPLGHSHRKAES